MYKWCDARERGRAGMPSFGTISIASAMVAECFFFFFCERSWRVEPYVKPSTTTSKVPYRPEFKHQLMFPDVTV